MSSLALLDDNIRQQLTEYFQNLPHPVILSVYRGPVAESASVLIDLANEVADLSDLVMIQETSQAPVLEPGHQGSEGVQSPVLEVLAGSGESTGVRFVGIPSGHEFSALIEAIRSVSSQTTGLSDQAKASLDQIKSPVHIQVFTTPT